MRDTIDINSNDYLQMDAHLQILLMQENYSNVALTTYYLESHFTQTAQLITIILLNPKVLLMKLC